MSKVRKDGYVYEYAGRDHPRATKKGYVLQHVLVVERVLGKYLPVKAAVHHVNGDPGDNRPQNLVVCEDNIFHKFLHLRQKALEACGHPHWRRCGFCKKWDDPKNLRVRLRQTPHHPACNAADSRERARKKREVVA